MHGNSSPIRSSQPAVHPRLADEVLRHFGTPWRAPSSPHVDAAADAIVAALAQRPLLLDSGCGDGSSTLALARIHPGHVAVGIDRSAVRLGARRDGDEALFLRTDVPRLWQALRARGISVARHFLLYPNPSPKPAQRMRRWHCHPAFPDLLALGGELELRTNWRVYADEFATALAVAGRMPVLDAVPEGDPLTPFERKYRSSAHALWRVRATL